MNQVRRIALVTVSGGGTTNHFRPREEPHPQVRRAALGDDFDEDGSNEDEAEADGVLPGSAALACISA